MNGILEWFPDRTNGQSLHSFYQKKVSSRQPSFKAKTKCLLSLLFPVLPSTLILSSFLLPPSLPQRTNLVPTLTLFSLILEWPTPLLLFLMALYSPRPRGSLHVISIRRGGRWANRLSIGKVECGWWWARGCYKWALEQVGDLGVISVGEGWSCRR